MRINIWGTVRSPTSWAHVTRELILALDKRGHDVSVTACRGFLHESTFPLPARLHSLLEKPRTHEVVLAFEYPPSYYKIQADLRAGLLVYETTVLPPHWADAIRAHLHVLIVPSRFCANIMKDAGIPDEMVHIVPYGVRPELFRAGVQPAQLPTQKKFTFLTIAMPHKRKALDILLQAYCREFDASDDVTLILKSSYKSREDKRRPWEIDFGRLIAGFASRPECPEILHICEPAPPEALPALYAACDCYVQPSRSEGFGLAILEAFACGKPAIVTGWGGHMDFCNESNAYVLQYSLEPAGDVQYDNDAPEALCACPDRNHLRALMRKAYEGGDTLLKKSKAALATASNYPWSRAAEEIERILMQRKGDR